MEPSGANSSIRLRQGYGGTDGKVWEADPLLCPKCGKEMRIVALIDDREVIESILRHLGLWEQGVRVSPSTGPPVIVPGERIIESFIDDAFPDYDTEPVMVYANG